MSDPNPKAKAEEPIGCVPILKPIAASHGLYVVAVCLAHGYKEPESLPCPLCERAAREEVQESFRLEAITSVTWRERAEQAEARLAEAVMVLKDVKTHVKLCNASNPGTRLEQLEAIDAILSSSAPPPILAELKVLRAENRERCEHCGSNRIYHGPPDCPGCGAPNCCQNCCKTAALESELERLRRIKEHHEQFPMLDAKWLDPECHDGCQSLVFQKELERLCKSEIDLLNAMSIPWKHHDGPVNGVDGCACIACELHRAYQTELAALKAELELLKCENTHTCHKCGLRMHVDEQPCPLCGARAELTALKLKLEVAKGAFGKLLSEISERTHKHYDKREASFVGNVVCLNSTLEAADEALSQLNGESPQPMCADCEINGPVNCPEHGKHALTTDGTGKVLLPPFPEGKEMIQTGRTTKHIALELPKGDGKVLLTKEQEPRTRTLLRSMLAAFDRGDSDTYWATFGILLEVHKEVMSADTKGTST